MKTLSKWLILMLVCTITTRCMVIDVNATCSTKEDCADLYQCTNNICVHKSLFPITFREVGGTVFILVLNSIMTAGGVGAGAAYVPYIILIFQHTLKKSIYIAYACVFGGGLGNLANIIRLKNPKTNRYMINYDVNLVILPALMIGVLIGVLLSRIFAPFITNLLLLLVLGYSIWKNFFKLKINLAKERKERAVKKQAIAQQVDIKADIVPSEPIQGRQIQEEGSEKTEQEAPHKLSKIPSELIPFDKISSSSTNSISKENEAESSENSVAKSKADKKASLMRKEQRFPFHKIGILLLSVIITVVIGIIRGSKRFEPVVGVQWSCGWDFIWLGIAILAFVLNLILNVYLVKKWQKEKLEVDYEFLPEEPLLNRDRTLKLTVGSTAAGIIGALVALGGALIIGPVLLGMHMPPAFSAATTGVFMIFSMFNAMYSTILDGQLSGQELAWFLPLAFVFSFISSKLVNWYVKKTGRQSTVILTVMSGVIMGFVCLLVIFIQANIEDFKTQIKFNSLC